MTELKKRLYEKKRVQILQGLEELVRKVNEVRENLVLRDNPYTSHIDVRDLNKHLVEMAFLFDMDVDALALSIQVPSRV